MTNLKNKNVSIIKPKVNDQYTLIFTIGDESLDEDERIYEIISDLEVDLNEQIDDEGDITVFVFVFSKDLNVHVKKQWQWD